MPRYITALSAFIKQHRAECICFALLIVLTLFGSYCHEPTYDEAQSWQIAKTASWHDMVFLIPIYEGHPPFWHLFLSIPAKLGIHWHLAYPSIGLLCVLASGFLIFFKAPFPRWVRCLLPFNFFLLYQYGIVVRPYCIMMVLILLLALFFPQKDKRPGLFVGLLSGLCMCHLFGIAIAGGITLAWLWEMKTQRPWKEYIPALCKDKRFHYMLGMLALVAVITLLLLVPRAEYNFLTTFPASRLQQIIYIFLALPADAVLTNLNEAIRTYAVIFPWVNLLTTAAIGLLLWAATLLFFPRKKLSFLLLPYLCLGIIMINYSSSHHIGLGLLLFIWYFWITLAQDAPITTWPSTMNKLAKGLLGLCLIVPIIWSTYSLYLDYRLSTFEGPRVVAFLKKYNLMDEVIFSSWKVEHLGSGNFITNPELQPFPVMLNMYLDHNIVANFHNGENKGYLFNAILLADQREKLFEQWKKHGLPMVTLGLPPLNVIYNETGTDLSKLYRVALINKQCEVRKLRVECFSMNIYLHEKLWEKYGDQILKENGIDPTQVNEKPLVPSNPKNQITIGVYR